MPRPNLLRRCTAEGLAAFALVFAGCGAVFGLIIMVMIYATGHPSGAHINPAVTIAFTPTRHFPPRDAVAYIGAQLAGATAERLMARVPLVCLHNAGRTGAP